MRRIFIDKLLRFIIFITLCFGINAFAQGQGCNAATPTYTVNLTGNPNGTYTSPSIKRDGSCCSDNNCIEFVVTLDPTAEQVRLSIISGAVANAMTYQVGCLGST